jgi:glycosyltransferase involved in cell wall biosynthesis
VICPRINLVDKSGVYCGEPGEKRCNECLTESPNDFGVTSIKEWRQINYQSLRNAQSVYAPSKDALVRIQKYYPKINIEYRSHAINENQLDIHRKGFIKELPKLTQSMRVLIIGAISNLKGFEVLLGLAQDAKERKLPLEFILQGYSKKDQLLEKYNVMVIGRYSEDESVALTESINPDLILYPSIWPETYSYTLDVAFLAKIPVIAFNIGAIPERLKENSWNHELISLDNAFSPSIINAQILGFCQELKDLKNNAICI